MRNRENKRVKLNNAGMSLVELLIAMAIMAVAVIPLLFAFVNMARYNGRSRELQQTTVLAHTVMENCKAYSMTDINTQMSTGTFLPGVTAAQTDIQGNIYYMTSVPLENQLYDVALEFVPRGINGDATTSFDIIDTKSMNPYLDAVFTAQGTETIVGDLTAAELDHNAYLSAFEKISAAIEQQTKTELGDGNKVTLSTSYIESSFKDVYDPNYGSFNIQRETYIVLWPSGDEDRVRVVVRYTFQLNGGKYTYKHVDAAGDPKDYVWTYGSGENVMEYEFSIYNNYAIDDPVNHPAKVENIYFFYYPAYQNNPSMYPFISDYIQITNDLADGTGGREFNVYLIKQKNPSYSDTNLSILETGYQVTVKGFNTAGADPDINIYHNFDVNLGGGSSTAFQPSWFSNVTNVNSDYVQTENKTLMYDVKLSIYDAGSYDASAHALKVGAQPVLTMDGTALDW